MPSLNSMAAFASPSQERQNFPRESRGHLQATGSITYQRPFTFGAHQTLALHQRTLGYFPRSEHESSLKHHSAAGLPHATAVCKSSIVSGGTCLLPPRSRPVPEARRRSCRSLPLLRCSPESQDGHRFGRMPFRTVRQRRTLSIRPLGYPPRSAGTRPRLLRDSPFLLATAWHRRPGRPAR